MKIKSKLSFILFFLLILVFWQWWLPGPRVASDFSLLSSNMLKALLDFPQTWSVKGTEGLGEYTVFTLWSWPTTLLYGFFSNLGFSFEIVERILVIIPFLLIGTYGVWRLSERFRLSIFAKVVSLLFYLTNTYILLVIDGGQLSISLAYACFPLGFLAIEKAIQGNLKKKIIAGLIVSAIGVFDIRFVYILLLLSIFIFLYEFFFLNSKKWGLWVLEGLKSGLVILFIVLGLNAYWILVFIKFPLSSNFYSSLTQTSFTSFISLGHAILLLSPHWFQNVFGNITLLKSEFTLIPILVLLAPILRRKDKTVGFWLLISLISIFLTKGSSEPLSGVYQWLYHNLPGFSLFRDSSKFFFLVVLADTVLIGISVDEIIKRINSSRIKISFILILVFYFIVLIRPIWLGEMTGTFSNPVLQKEFSEVDNFLSKDNEIANVFWIPTISPLTSLDFHHPAIEASRLSQKRPFAQATVGSYETFNFLREASYMGQLFEVANIKYIVYPPLNPKRDNLHPDNIRYYHTFLDQLSNLPWLSKLESLSIPTLQVKQYQDKLFITPNYWWVVGSDSIYNEATKSAKLSLSKNALIFAEETAGLGRMIREIPDAKVILYKKQYLDLAVAFINKEDLIFPSRELNYNPDKSGWWKRDTLDFLNFREFLNTKYSIDNQDFDLGGGWALGEGSVELKIKNDKIQKGNKLIARVLESSQSGKLTFLQNDKTIGEINTDSQQTNLRWFEVGDLIEDSKLSISAKGNLNIINALVSLSPNVWQEYKNNVSDLEKQNKIVNFEPSNTKEGTAKVSYKQLSSTKYIVTVQNLSAPSILIFSQNYDINWKLNGQTPLPIFSFLNGFNIEKNGTYELNFEPQKYVPLGLMVSLVTLITCVVLLLV